MYIHKTLGLLKLQHDVFNSDTLPHEQTGATPRITIETIHLLIEKFNGIFPSRTVDTNWSPKSCCLTPLDYFYMKDVYKPSIINS